MRTSCVSEMNDINPKKPPKEAKAPFENNLKGTTFLVYRYLVRQREPVGVSKVQRELNLSSPSVSEYHLKKLLDLGLVRAEHGGYVVDKVVLFNMVKIGRISIPLHTAYVTFFGATLAILILLLRPNVISSIYFFALVINCAAVAISIYETIKTQRRY